MQSLWDWRRNVAEMRRSQTAAPTENEIMKTKNLFVNMQNGRLTTKLRSALGFESLALVYAFLLAGSLGAQSVYIPYTFTTLAGLAVNPGSADGTGSAARF